MRQDLHNLSDKELQGNLSVVIPEVITLAKPLLPKYVPSVMAGKFANFVPAAESALANALSAMSDLQKLEIELAVFFGEDPGDKENGSIESILAGLHGLYSEIKKCLHKKKLLKLVNSDASQGRGKDYTFVGQVALTNQGTGIVLADRIDGVIEVNLGWSLKQILLILIRFLLFLTFDHYHSNQAGEWPI
jgi:hypothetical protein